MNVDDNPSGFVVQVVRSTTSSQPDPRSGIVAGDLEVSAAESLEALHASKGSDAVFHAVPQLLDLPSWHQVAAFTVRSKSGTARYLDLWDVDHFDGYTDVRKTIDEGRVWFSDKGFDSWGSGQSRTGRINCYFTAPQAGSYVCTARLVGDAGPAVVECLIDSSSFGQLFINGSITQAHPCELSAGGHHFRIRQVQGAFFFLSLTVFRVG